MGEEKSNFREVKLKAEIEAYDKNIDEYRRALQTESVWLFLAVLGCWSVSSNSYIQTFAFLITIAFFGIRVASKLTYGRAFNSFESSIQDLIEREFISGPAKDDYVSRLALLKKKRASNIQPLKAAPMFFLCIGFLVWSIYDQIVLQFIGQQAHVAGLLFRFASNQPQMRALCLLVGAPNGRDAESKFCT